MSFYLGDFAEDATVYIPFNTFTSDDPSASSTITNLADGDIKVHKDGSTTEIATDGASVSIDFDSITGNHLITVDTSAHADYSTGSDYLVRIEGTTVDGATVNAWVGHFSIENRTTFPKADYPSNFSALGIESDGDLAKVNTLDGHTAQTGDSYARLGAPAGASVSADVAAVKSTADAIETDTQDLQTQIGTDGAGLTNIPWNSSWDTEVQSECNDALVAIHLDHLLATDYDPASKPGTSTALLNELVESDSGVSRFTVNALENGPSGSGASAASIADAVWDEALSGHTTAGSAGKALADIESDATAILADTNELQTNQGNWATATGFSTHSAADVWAVATRVLTAGTNLNDLDAAGIRAALGMASADLDDQLDAKATAAALAVVDGIVDDLKSGIIYGSAATGTLSTTQATTNLTGYADDQLIGRHITVLTGNAAGEQTDITDYAETGGLLTFTALTAAMGNGDTFKIT